MRPLWPSFVFLLLQEAESAAPDGTPTTVAALNLSSLPPRGEVTASVKPIPVQLQDGSGDKSGDKHEEKEERFGLPQTSSVLEGSTHVAGWNGWLSVPLDFPIDRSKFSKIFEKSNVVNEDQVMQWFTKFHTPGQSFRGDDLVTGLIRDGHGEELVRLFQEMWFFPELKERAAMMQRALLAEEPTLLPLVFNVWLGAKVTPAEAFRMMSLSVKKSTSGGASEIKSWPVIFPKLRYWLVYVRDYQLKWNDFSQDQVIDVLVGDSRSEAQLVNFFHWLRKKPGMDGLAGGLQKKLVLRSLDPTKTLRLMFGLCLISKADPREVFYMMPILSLKSRAIGDTRSRFASLPMLKHWMGYVSEYRSKVRDFNDDQVFELVNSLPEVDVAKFSF
uniref:RxLR effector candidate protein n=1 Tax=Peronospora matthiolae TaxID=2874970 RepID=A0AAV1U3A1_9STRA